MGHVTDALRARVLRQVEEHGIVVWFDPERAYASVAESLSAPESPVACFKDGVFRLRREIESSLSAPERPRLVVYVPGDEAELGAALAEVIAASVVMRPGQQPVARNTRLSVVARAALAERLPAEALDAVVRQVDAGQLGLADLDRLAEAGATASTGALSLLFGTSQPAEIALVFLADTSRDEALVEKGALGDLEALLSVEFGLLSKGSPTPAALRDRLAVWVLTADLLGSTAGQPGAFPDLARSSRSDLEARAREVARAWRNRRDFQRSYVARSIDVERDLDLASHPRPQEVLEACETFRGLEERLQEAIEQRLLAEADGELLSVAERRIEGFWAAVAPELMDRWALVLAIGRVLVKGGEIERVLASGRAPAEAGALSRRYVGEGDEEPWALLDTYHRQMERRYHVFDVDVTGAHRSIEQLVAKARDRYANVASTLAERFLGALQTARFSVPGLPRQVETFERFVRPSLERGKVAYLLVDGLRFEMARELHLGVDQEHEADLVATLGTLPSVTEVGMAALLPDAHHGLELVAAGGGKVAVRIGDALVRNRKERLDVLAERAGCATHATRLEALLPPNKKTRDAIREAKLVVATATDELDGLCEAGNVAMARRLMDDVLLQIWRGLRVLFDLGVDVAIVTADHGHLFGEALDTGTMIDPPGGQTMDLHRRVWVGRGGAASESYLRVKAAEVGLTGDLELALPRTLAGFRAPGASGAYLHGGASPQELLLPVWTVTRSGPAVAAGGEIAWRLTPGSAVISARFLSVQIEGAVTGLFGAQAPLVRLEVREGKKVLSRPVASSYGFEDATGFVQMRIDEAGDKSVVRPNTVTLLLEATPGGKTVEVVAIDVATERVLARLPDVPVSLGGF